MLDFSPVTICRGALTQRFAIAIVLLTVGSATASLVTVDPAATVGKAMHVEEGERTFVQSVTDPGCDGPLMEPSMASAWRRIVARRADARVRISGLQLFRPLVLRI